MVFQVAGSPIGATSVLIAVLASMGGFLFGYDTGQISDIEAYDDFIRRFATGPVVDGLPTWNTWIEGLITGLLSIGTMFGVLAGAPIADRLGRKNAMSIEATLFILGCIVQCSAFHAWYQVGIGRFITGLGVGGLSAAVPLYQSETVPRQVRGALVATYQLFITFGIFVSYAFGLALSTRQDSDLSWRLLIILGIPFALLLGIGIQFCPESPRWLAKNGRNDEAYRALAKVRGANPGESNAWVEQEYADILIAVEEERGRPAAGWIDCFKPQRKTLYRTILGMTLQAGQQLTGANYFFYYGTDIFTSAGLSNQFATQLILGGVNFFCTFFGAAILERFGRRRPLLFGAAWMVVWLVVFATAGVAGNPNTRGIGILQIVSACIYIMGYATTWAPGIWLWIGENFALQTRAKQASLAALSNWIWNFLIAYFTPSITGNISYYYGYVFAGANLLNFFVAFFFVYETEKLTLEQIDELYLAPVKPWRSVSWVPAGYSSRDEVRQEGIAEDDATKIQDPKPQWRSKPDPLTGEETDRTRKAPINNGNAFTEKSTSDRRGSGPDESDASTNA